MESLKSQSFAKEKKGDPENKILQAPISEEIMKQAEGAEKEFREVDRVIEKHVQESRKKLRDEEIPPAEEKEKKIMLEIGAKAKKELDQWLQKIYKGEYGNGELVVIKHREKDTLMRVIPIEKPVYNPSTDEARERDRRNKEKINMLAKKIDSDYVCTPENTGNIQTYQDVKKFLLLYEFAAVDFAKTTREELDNLYKKLKDNGRTMAYILKVFPSDYKPEVTAGEILPFGGSSHHSGDISGSLIVLPTGRFAVISEYSGEKERQYGTQQFWGVLDDLMVDPNWSACYVDWEGPELSKLTDEEYDFLKGNSKFKDIPMITDQSS